MTERNDQHKPLTPIDFSSLSELHRVLFEEAADGMFITDPGWRYVTSNPQFCEMTGYSSRELLSINHQDLVAPADLARDPIPLEDLRQGKSVTRERRFIRKDGSLIAVEIRARMLPGNYVLGIVRDISERKRSETALASEKQFSDTVIDAIPGLFVVLDQNGTLLRWNKNTETLLGYTAAELRGMQALQAITKEDQDRVAAMLHEIVKNGYASALARIVTKDGRKIPYQLNGLATVISGKRYLVTTAFDMAERIQAEEAMAAERSLSDDIINSLPGIFYMFDDQGRLVRWNKKFEDVTGYTAEELLGMYVLDFFTEEHKQYILTRVQSVFNTGESFAEAPFRLKDGTQVPYFFTGLLAILDGDRYLLGVGIDITEHKRTEEAIVRERRFSDGIINSLPGIFYMFDDQGRLVRWNKKFTDVTGYTAEELLGMHITSFFKEKHKGTILSRLQLVFAGGESFGEIPFLIKSGKQIPYFFTGRQAVLDGRRYLLGVGIDITERVRAEEEKARLQAQLSQSQKLETIGRLAGGVAHDFNNMLGVILGQTELTIMRLSPSDPLRTRMGQIQQAAERSAALIQQLLAFARQQTISPKVLDLNKTVEGMLKMLGRLIGEDIELIWQPGSNLSSIKMDPTQIDQILANLCLNSRDAIAGGGKVTIETADVTLDQDYCARHRGFVPGEFVMLAVSDNGCGFDKETQAKLFEPFFTTKTMGKGTGLGLATIYGIVKQNEGFINVYSEPGQGTTFRIYLRRYTGDDHMVAASDRPAIRKGHEETILLVEDEPSILMVGTSMLKELGYQVMAVGTSHRAIQLAETHSGEIHLLMTDVVMPEMNGRQLAERIEAIRPGIKCLFMSGYTSNAIAHRGVLDEGVSFLQKPFSIQALAAKIREVMDQNG